MYAFICKHSSHSKHSIFVLVYTRACVYECLYVYICLYVRFVCMFVYVYVCICVFMCMYVCPEAQHSHSEKCLFGKTIHFIL